MPITFWLFSRLGFIEIRVTGRDASPDVLSAEFEVIYIYIDRYRYRYIFSDLQNIRLLNVV